MRNKGVVEGLVVDAEASCGVNLEHPFDTKRLKREANDAIANSEVDGVRDMNDRLSMNTTRPARVSNDCKWSSIDQYAMH